MVPFIGYQGLRLQHMFGGDTVQPTTAADTVSASVEVLLQRLRWKTGEFTPHSLYDLRKLKCMVIY